MPQPPLFNEECLGTQFNGSFLISMTPSPFFLFIQTLPSSGTLNWSVSIPRLAPGIPAASLYIQAILAERKGEIFLGPQQTLLILDDVY